MARPSDTRGRWYSEDSSEMDVTAALWLLRKVGTRPPGRHETGDRPEYAGSLSRPDRIEVTRIGSREGYSGQQIAALLGCDVRTVNLYRKILRAEGRYHK